MTRKMFVGTLMSLTVTYATQALATQTYFVDFDTIAEAFAADPSTPGLPPADEIYDYSAPQRDMIIGYLNTNFGLYDMTFVEGLPIVPGGSVIKLNDGFGAGSDGVDFRNEDSGDDAKVNTISIFKFLGLTAGDWSDDDVAIATANIVGHEASHLQGMRHHDAYEPIGSGIVGLDVGDFLPAYPGPTSAPGASEMFSSLHFGGVGFGFTGLTTPSFVSERSAVRFELARPFSGGFVDAEMSGNNAFAMAQFVDVDSGGFTTPYPLRPEIDVSMIPPDDPEFIPTELAGLAKVVTGSFDVAPGSSPISYLSDYYEFFGVAGEIWTFEVMSKILEGGDRYADHADPAIILLDGTTGGVIPYYSDAFGAINDDDDDGELGASLIDVVLPFTGSYVIEVLVSNPFIGGITGAPKAFEDGGSYELYMYTAMPASFIAIPEPSSCVMIALALVGGALQFRRRSPV